MTLARTARGIALFRELVHVDEEVEHDVQADHHRERGDIVDQERSIDVAIKRAHRV